MEATKRPWTAHILDCPKDKIGEYVQQCVEASGGEEFHFISAPHEDGGDADIAHVGNGPRGKYNAALIVRAVNTFEQARKSMRDLYEFFIENHENVGLEVYGQVNGKELSPTAQRLNALLDQMNDILAAMEAPQ